MKDLLNWSRSVSLGSLRLRLMLYLLIAGSVPLVCALLVFYQQSAHYTKQEYESFVVQSHAMLAKQMQQNLKKIESEAAAINANRSAQQLMLSSTGGFVSGSSELLSELDATTETVRRDLPVSDVCFTFFDSNVSICRDLNVLRTNAPASKQDDRIEAFIPQENAVEKLRYVAPLYVLQTGEIKGYMVAVIDEYRLLYPPSSSFPILEHALLNENGAQILGISITDSTRNPRITGAETPSIRTTNSGVISSQSVNVFSKTWTSVMRWENQSFSELKSSLGRTAILFLILLVLLSVTVAILFSRGVTRPLKVLRSLMKRAELGDLKAYWTSGAATDIDELGESYNQMLNRLEDSIKQVKVEESLKKEKEFEALQYQLNPHFLYNTLNTIKWVAKIHKTPQISEAVSALVRLMQASLGKKGDFLPLNEEVALVRDYMEIQTFRYGDEIQVITEIEPVAGLCLVPKLILQPLVENAIIHGLDKKAGKEKQITIKAWLDRDLLLCQVEDNGKGMDPELLLSEQNGRREGIKEKMSGIGLKHIREKIKLYYGPDYKMLIFSKPNQGTTIRLSLPIHRSEES